MTEVFTVSKATVALFASLVLNAFVGFQAKATTQANSNLGSQWEF